MADKTDNPAPALAPAPRPRVDPRLVMATVKSGKTPGETTDAPGSTTRR